MASSVQSPAPSTSSATASPSILPLHPTQKQSTIEPATGLVSMAEHRQALHRKMAEQKETKFASPTDELMSPCSQRLKDYKTKKATRLPQTLFKNSKAGIAPMAKNLFAKRSAEKLTTAKPLEVLVAKDNESSPPTENKVQVDEDEKMSGYDL